MLEKFKQYARIEDEDNAFLEMLLTAAELTVWEAGVKPPKEVNDLYDVLILMIASHWYDNRGVAASGTYSSSFSEIPMSASWIIQQLR